MKTNRTALPAGLIAVAEHMAEATGSPVAEGGVTLSQRPDGAYDYAIRLADGTTAGGRGWAPVCAPGGDA